MDQHTFAHYGDLSDSQKEAMVRLLSYEHRPPNPEHPDNPVRPIQDKDMAVALLKNGKPIAAIVTNGRQKVYNWAGRMDKKFLGQFGHTPAEEMIRQHLFRLRGKNMTYDYRMEYDARLAFDNRLLAKGVARPKKRNQTRTIKIPPELRKELTSALKHDSNAWRIFRIRRH